MGWTFLWMLVCNEGLCATKRNFPLQRERSQSFNGKTFVRKSSFEPWPTQPEPQRLHAHLRITAAPTVVAHLTAVLRALS